MDTIENKIYEEVKNRCLSTNNAFGIGAWEHHIELVYKLAKENAENYGADKEIVALAALLHDIASVTNKDYVEEHHIIGASIAEELLKNENYPEERIESIKKCILNHRGSRLVEKNTPEEICIADADAMAHFSSIPSLFSMVYKEKQLPINEGAEFVKNKLERSYNKLSPKGKEIVEKQYGAIKLLFDK
ncbi:MAG: HD domain-containing protein [Clostridia bacterium]|nr:HD domain-containing protein [Clostridia bacterium]